MRIFAPVGLLIYEQSIEKDALFLRKNVVVFFGKNSLKITFKHYLSEMYLLHEKAQPLSFHYAQGSPHFPCFTELLEKEYGIRKNMITLSTVHNLKTITLEQFIHKI